MSSTVTYLINLWIRTPYPTLWRTRSMRMTDLFTPRGNKRVTPHLTSLLYRSSQTPKGVNLTALDSVSRPKDSSKVPGFQLERVLS